jgi:hypothetical protein
VAVTLSGHVVDVLGVSVIDTPEPVTLPLSTPPLVLLELVDTHVPDREASSLEDFLLPRDCRWSSQPRFRPGLPAEDWNWNWDRLEDRTPTQPAVERRSHV